MAEHKIYCRVIGTNSVVGTILMASKMMGGCTDILQIEPHDHVVIRTYKVDEDYAAIQGDILNALEYFNLYSIQIQDMRGKILHVKNNPAPRVVFHEPG